jgi:hypothetical protein
MQPVAQKPDHPAPEPYPVGQHGLGQELADFFNARVFHAGPRSVADSRRRANPLGDWSCSFGNLEAGRAMLSRLTVRPDIFLRLLFFDERVDVKAADFIQPQPAPVFRPKFDDPALLLNGGGTLGVLHGIEIRQVLRRVIGKLWGAFQHRQIIARPVNVERF